MVAKQQNEEDSLTTPFLIDCYTTKQEPTDIEKAKGVHLATHLSLNGNTSFFKTTFNGLNAFTGVGILSVPYALSSGGWLSLIFMFVIASTTFYTGLLIKRCMEFDPNIRSVSDIGEKAFGAKGRVAVSVFENLELYLVRTGSLLLAGTITNASMGILGYLMFGSKLQSQITLNLPTNKLGSKVALYTALVNPIAKYALMLRPIFEAIESHYGRKNHYSILTRSMLLGSSVIVALTLPFYGYWMSLAGAFPSVACSILIPCLCYFKISGAYRKFDCVSVIIGFSTMMGLLILVLGT